MKEQFLKDVENHKMTRISENEWKFSQDDDTNKHFYITKSTDHLIYTGDMGCYVFKFNGHNQYAFFANWISIDYVSEKLTAYLDRDLFKYNVKSCEAEISEWVQSLDFYEDLTPEKQSELLSEACAVVTTSSSETRDMLSEIEFNDIPFFLNEYLDDLRINVGMDYHPRYLWCLEALKWGCRQIIKELDRQRKILEKSDKDEVILESDDRAAIYLTNIKGWVSREGRYWGEHEEYARQEGSTHKKCTECGALFDKKWSYSICGECRSKIDELKDIEKYATYKREPYNGNVLYSGYFNECFNDLVDIIEHADYNSDYENTEELQNLSDDEIIQKFRVTMTEQCYCKVVDSESIIENYSDLDDDEIIPNVILEALDELNKLIEETPINYYEPVDVIPVFKSEVKK